MKFKHWGVAAVVLAWAGAAAAGYPEGYYDRMEGKSREALKAAAKACVKTHRQLEYYDLPNYWQYTDVYPELTDGCPRWWDMYSDAVYLIRPGQTGKQAFSANKMHREHAVPKSWWKYNNSVEYTPAYSDMWNLYPSDASANQAKNNYAFGPTRSTTFDNGVTKVGYPAAGYGGGSQFVFEPADEYKGDFARAIFYMATVYDDIQWQKTYDWMFVRADYPTLVPWAYTMLLQWSRLDPVSQKEIDRNDAVEQYQGNRNPYVDFPELAEYVWGQRTSQVFHIADQPNTGLTPPISGDPEITAPVNGESLDFGQTAVGVTARRALQITGNNMTEPLSLRVVGAARDAFSTDVTSIPPVTINTNGGYLLDIAYTPAATGQHEAKLTLYDGGIQGSISVTLRGEALARPAMETLRALPPAALSADGYTARWEAPSGIADYYTLTRVRHLPGGDEPETYETGETQYALTGRDPGVAESYYVTYSRLGLESPQSNSVYVAPAGIALPGAASDARAYGADGCIVIVCDGAASPCYTVTDLAGRIIVTETSAWFAESEAAGDLQVVTLPVEPGVYIVAMPGRRPVKIRVN